MSKHHEQFEGEGEEKRKRGREEAFYDCGRKKREVESEQASSSSCWSLTPVACKMDGILEEHVSPFLRIIREERNNKIRKNSWENMRKSLHAEVNVSYKTRTMKMEYKRQYNLYKSFLFIKRCGYEIDEQTRAIEVVDDRWQNMLDGAPVEATCIHDLLCVRISTELIQLWKDLFDLGEVPTNAPTFKFETVEGQELLLWKPADGKDMTRSSHSGSSSRGARYNPCQEADTHEAEELCDMRLLQIRNLPRCAYVRALDAVVGKGKFFAKWLLKQNDFTILSWVETLFKERNAEFETFFESWQRSWSSGTSYIGSPDSSAGTPNVI